MEVTEERKQYFEGIALRICKRMTGMSPDEPKNSLTRKTPNEMKRVTTLLLILLLTAASAVAQNSVAGSRPAVTNPYTLALRTNLLYDALLMPTLGIEWRISPAFGIKLDGSLSRWGSEHGKVQKLWMLNPEVRWYLLRDKRFYAGVSATYGEYNLYGYPLGKLFSGDTGYQGKLWGGGVTVGCQLPLTRCIALDFNLGLGYTRSEYDSFRMKNDTRVIRARDRSKNFFGPTQAGISLIWTIGNNK